jgi:O-antigen ligase
MINLSKLYKYSIFLMIFSLNYETVNFSGFEMNYFITKTTLIIMIIMSLHRFKDNYEIIRYKQYVLPLIVFYFLLIISNVSFLGNELARVFEVPLFLNIVIFITIINISYHNPSFSDTAIRVFVVSAGAEALMHILDIGAFTVYVDRESMFGGNANEYGIRLGIALIILSFMMTQRKAFKKKFDSVIYLTYPFLLVSLISTGSRVAFLTMVFGSGVVLIFKSANGIVNRILSLLSITISLSLVWTFMIKDTFVVSRLIESIQYGDTSSRIYIWSNIVHLIRDNPIMGIGSTGYHSASLGIFNGYVSPHNVFLEVMIYTGILGTIVFCVFLFRVFLDAFKNSVNKSSYLSIGLAAPIIGQLLSGQMLDQKVLWLLLGIIVSTNTQNKLRHKMNYECSSSAQNKN